MQGHATSAKSIQENVTGVLYGNFTANETVTWSLKMVVIGATDSDASKFDHVIPHQAPTLSVNENQTTVDPDYENPLQIAMPLIIIML